MKLLYIGNKITKTTNGRSQVDLRNQYILGCIFNEIKYMSLEVNSMEQLLTFGITSKFIKSVNSELRKEYDYIFVSHSGFGRICKIIKKSYPQLKIITFFHNIEKQYAEEYIKVSGLKGLFYYLRVAVWERMAVKNSDYCITLNERDSFKLKSIYNRDSDAIMPTSLEDKFLEHRKVLELDKKDLIDYLFVGAAFYPNIQGMQWFIDNIIPNVDGHLYIIGVGMKSELFHGLNKRIHVLGFVDDLSEYYRRARIVVSPIFSGGGMKTKTAEALMYGKFIIGTDEAFEGYHVDKNCMCVCNEKNEFIKSIKIKSKEVDLYNEASRDMFLNFHSYSSSLNTLRNLITNS